MDGEEPKGLLWRMPSVISRDIGKLGPGIGYGLGCGLGLGAGLLGGAGLGIGLPGLQFGMGIGAGCGLGIGYGYGLGKGWAYDENGKHRNIGRPWSKLNPIANQNSRHELEAVWDDLVTSVQSTYKALEREINKRKR